MSIERVALVTGATRGLGFETVRQLAQVGVHVLLGARKLDDGEAKARVLRDEGLDVEAIHLDMNELDTVWAAAAEIKELYGRLDILVNNAGILPDGDGYPSSVNVGALRDALEVNFVAAAVVTQAMLPHLKASSAPRIVNVSSSMGSMWWNADLNNPAPNNKALGYGASKAALNMLTVQLAWELRDTNAKVNSVCPGYVKTDINKGGGFTSVEEGARAAVTYALIGDEGPTGQFLNTSGTIPW
ncbi:SDR family oxidoreductase [Rhizobium rhizogenes]|uniref:Short-chain dehydrogenase n=1 Tax=Rhizobium rhizogenes TaxID=359 RepID=A0AA92BZZ0_RHIRH|nr:SDR family oxidoreductase [Rhizobium rhizogenes]PVE50627.1 short-chain dehydrogenase [Rhizobium rhizogenes]PVE62372.1 short-chain dehydrogenase [Agrobacterium tumefaciens]PVE70555.1 short-chain dehydrogenase [Sphingomonas sp. TPD3009]